MTIICKPHKSRDGKKVFAELLEYWLKKENGK